jgi:hypothetical protein
MRRAIAKLRWVAVVVAVALVGAFELAAPQEAAPARFAVVDVYVDSAEPLAAWQFELAERGGGMQVVGIEGGDGASFGGEPPFYDRGAVDRGAADRIIVADYSLSPAADLPVGRTRVASVHVRLASAAPDYDLRLVAAGAADGRPIDAEISFAMRTGR